MLKILPILFLLIFGLVSDGCVAVMKTKNEKIETQTENVILGTSKSRIIDYTENYIAIEYSKEKYEKAPVMKINQYNDGSAFISMDMAGQTGIFGTCPYGAFGMVTLYIGSENMKKTYATAEISTMENRTTILFTYPMGECETIVYEKVIK